MNGKGKKSYGTGKFKLNCIHCDWIKNNNTHRDTCVLTTDMYKAYINRNRFAYAFSVVLTKHDPESHSNTDIQHLLYSINHFRQYLAHNGFTSSYFLINRTTRYKNFANNKEHAHAWIIVNDKQRFDSMYRTVNGCNENVEECVKMSDKDERSVYKDAEYIVGYEIVPELENIFLNKDYYIIENGTCLLLRYKKNNSVDNKLKKYDIYDFMSPDNTRQIRSKCGDSNELRLRNESINSAFPKRIFKKIK